MFDVAEITKSKIKLQTFITCQNFVDMFLIPYILRKLFPDKTNLQQIIFDTLSLIQKGYSAAPFTNMV